MAQHTDTDPDVEIACVGCDNCGVTVRGPHYDLCFLCEGTGAQIAPASEVAAEGHALFDADLVERALVAAAR